MGGMMNRESSDEHSHSDTAGQTAQARFASLATPLVDEAIGYANKVASNPDPEGLHKLRVALRRLRTLLWAYRPLLDREMDEKHRAFFKFLASAAGKTRDWDILTQLLCELRGDERTPLDDLRRARRDAMETSRETLKQAGVKPALRDALKQTNGELNSARKRDGLGKFARRRVAAAQKSLARRVRRARHARHADYASFHDVRKAGKKVRYLLEFFEAWLPRKQIKAVQRLKKIQKRLGELNDVVASENLVKTNLSVFLDRSSAKNGLAALATERERRTKRAAKLLKHAA
jgi:CHAD domain-containing protein